MPTAHRRPVRLIGVMGLKQQMRVFERSKLLPFSLGVKTDRRRPEETEWCAGRADVGRTAHRRAKHHA